MSAIEIALWKYVMCYAPHTSNYFNRDRFLLSIVSATRAPSGRVFGPIANATNLSSSVNMTWSGRCSRGISGFEYRSWKDLRLQDCLSAVMTIPRGVRLGLCRTYRILISLAQYSGHPYSLYSPQCTNSGTIQTSFSLNTDISNPPARDLDFFSPATSRFTATGKRKTRRLDPIV